MCLSETSTHLYIWKIKMFVECQTKEYDTLIITKVENNVLNDPHSWD